MRGNGHCLHQFLCCSSGESLYPEGGHSTLGQNDGGGHSTQGVILPSDNRTSTISYSMFFKAILVF